MARWLLSPLSHPFPSHPATPCPAHTSLQRLFPRRHPAPAASPAPLPSVNTQGASVTNACSCCPQKYPLMTRRGDKAEPAPFSASAGQGRPMYSSGQRGTTARGLWGAAPPPGAGGSALDGAHGVGTGCAIWGVGCTAGRLQPGCVGADPRPSLLSPCPGGAAAPRPATSGCPSHPQQQGAQPASPVCLPTLGPHRAVRTSTLPKMHSQPPAVSPQKQQSASPPARGHPAAGAAGLVQAPHPSQPAPPAASPLHPPAQAPCPPQTTLSLQSSHSRRLSALAAQR